MLLLSRGGSRVSGFIMCFLPTLNYPDTNRGHSLSRWHEPLANDMVLPNNKFHGDMTCKDKLHNLGVLMQLREESSFAMILGQ